MTTGSIYIGCAGWNIPANQKSNFPESGSHIERYAARLPAVEINSSFYKTHLDKTYIRWRETVPNDFRFSAKLPKTITHAHRLKNTESLLDTFLQGATQLKQKLGCLLIQLPPSLVFIEADVVSFLNNLKQRYDGNLVLEARHKSWFTSEVNHLMFTYQIAQAAADPSVCEVDGDPRGWSEFIYYRWHGSPEIYKSRYGSEQIKALAIKLKQYAREGKNIWCIFDNTTYGAAYANAFELILALNT